MKESIKNTIEAVKEHPIAFVTAGAIGGFIIAGGYIFAKKVIIPVKNKVKDRIKAKKADTEEACDCNEE